MSHLLLELSRKRKKIKAEILFFYGKVKNTEKKPEKNTYTRLF